MWLVFRGLKPHGYHRVVATRPARGAVAENAGKASGTRLPGRRRTAQLIYSLATSLPWREEATVDVDIDRLDEEAGVAVGEGEVAAAGVEAGELKASRSWSCRWSRAD